MAAAKKNTKNRKVSEVRVRKWTDRELKEFAYVLADDVNEFALSLETLALKGSANIHIFEQIKEELEKRLHVQMAEDAEESVPKKRLNKSIDTSVPKLRVKYKWLKDQWRKLTDRIKVGSGKSPIDEPEWFKILDPVFSETHAKLKIATKGADIQSSESDSGSGTDESKDGEGVLDGPKTVKLNSSGSSVDVGSAEEIEAASNSSRKTQIFNLMA